MSPHITCVSTTWQVIGAVEHLHGGAVVLTRGIPIRTLRRLMPENRSLYSAMATIEFFYDYASPFSYLADTRMPEVLARTGATLAYRPAILGVLIVESKNTPPPSIPAKIAYYGHDTKRWAKRLNVPMTNNPFFPVRSVTLMRAALVAQDLGCFAPFHRAMWAGMWIHGLNLGDNAVLNATLTSAGLDGQAIVDGTQHEGIKARLKANCDEALARGAFGLPTFFVGDEMFFGNDRVDFVEEAAAASSLQR